MHFFNTNCFYLFKEASTTTIFFVFERLQHSKPPSLSKSTQKLHKSFKNLNLSIAVQIWCIFSTQIAFMSSRKPPGQRIFSLFFVFDILSSQVFRKIDKKCIKIFKILNFRVFLSIWVWIWGIFSFKKLHLFLWKSLFDNNLFLFGLFSTLKARKFIDNLTEIA